MAGWFLLGAALAFQLGGYLARDDTRGASRDLQPYPDVVEYYAMARAIADGRLPTIRIGAEELPSRYPPGYAVAMLPWLSLPGLEQQIRAPARTSQTAAVAVLLAGFLFFRRRCGPFAAGIGCLLLATAPFFVTYARAPTSEMTALLLVGLASIAACEANAKDDLRRSCLAAVLLAAAVTVRLNCLFFAPLLIAVRCSAPTTVARIVGGLRRTAVTFAVFALALVPLRVVNTLTVGRPWTSGYAFWVPGSTDLSIANVPGAIVALLRECTATATDYAVAHIYGTGASVVPAFVLLAIVGLAALRPARADLPSLAGVGCYVACSLGYWLRDGRMYAPLFAFLCIPAAAAATGALQRIAAGRISAGAVGICGLLVAAVVGFPSQVDYPRRAWAVQAPYALGILPHRDQELPPRWQAARDLVALAAGQSAVVLSDINPVYLDCVLPSHVEVVPLDMRDGGYKHAVAWRFDRSKALQQVLDRAERGVTVLAALLRSEDTGTVAPLPEFAGWRWAERPSGHAAVRLFQLVAAE